MSHQQDQHGLITQDPRNLSIRDTHLSLQISPTLFKTLIVIQKTVRTIPRHLWCTILMGLCHHCAPYQLVSLHVYCYIFLQNIILVSNIACAHSLQQDRAFHRANGSGEVQAYKEPFYHEAACEQRNISQHWLIHSRAEIDSGVNL